MLKSEEITHHEPIVEDGKTEFNVSNMKLLKNISRPDTNSKPFDVNKLLPNHPSDQKYLEKITTKLLSKEEISKMIPASTHYKKCKKKEKNKSFSKKSKSPNNNNNVVEFPKLLKLKIPENCKKTASGYVNKKSAMIYPKLTYYQGSLIKDNNGTEFLRETEIPDKNLTTYKVGQYDDYLNHAAGPGSMNNFATFQFNIRKEMDKKLQESNEKLLNRKINASTNTDFKKQIVEDCNEQQQNVEKCKQTADIATETTDNCNQIDDFIENKTMVVVETEHNILEREIEMSKLVQKTRENEIVLPIIEITPPKAEMFKHMNDDEKISEIPFYSRKRSIVIKLPSYDTLDESELKQVHNTTEIIEEGQNEIEVESNTEKNGIEFNEQDFNAESDHNYSEDYESEDEDKNSEHEENYSENKENHSENEEKYNENEENYSENKENYSENEENYSKNEENCSENEEIYSENEKQHEIILKDYKNEIPDNIIVPRLFVPKPEPNPCAKPCFPESPRTEEEEYDSSTKGGGIFKKKHII